MSYAIPSLPRKSLSLTIRLSALLIAAVVLPLLITIITSEAILRPTLTAQATAQMENDAQSHVAAIDSALIANEQDLSVLGQFYAIQHFLLGEQIYREQALSELTLGYHLDSNFSAWTLFDKTGAQPRLSYPALPGRDGQYYIPPDILDQLQSPHKTLISDTYLDENTHTGYIYIYTTISSAQNKVIGIARATYMLTDIWAEVNNETNAASGSYAMIVDENGVRIGYTNKDTTLTTLPTALFKPIAPLSPTFQQKMQTENLYGANSSAVTTLADTGLASQLQSSQQSASFQFTPALQGAAYQAYRVQCQSARWTYIVLRPVSTITGAANQQDTYLLILAVAITILAAIVGILVGRTMTRPILRSVTSLTKSSDMLKTLAAREQARAKEQKWIVESAQTGLSSMQQYARASSSAAHKLDEMGREFAQSWERYDTQIRQRNLYAIISAANYIEKASMHQERTSKGLNTAIQVTNQVTEQLLSGATSASDAAMQMEEVIKQLRRLVGE
jgi:hypothetical protein